MKLTGAEILCETLTRWASGTFSAIRAARFFRSTTRSANPSCITFWCATNRAPRTWPTVMRAPRGGVGVAMATSGPGATNMVTGIATAMLDSSPVVCITGQVSSKLLGSDAFQEVDITGITMPITKHNVVVSRAEDIARTVREAFVIANSGRPGPVLVDITKDAQQATAEFDWEACAPKLPPKRVRKNHDQDGIRPRRGTAEHRQASGDSGRPRHHAFRRDAHV